MSDDDRKKRAAERVRQLRQSLNMEQPEFAEFLGLAKDGQSSISKWESAKSAPGPKAAALLAQKGGKDALYYQGLDPVAVTDAANVRMARLVGDVQAGAWRETVEDEGDHHEVPVPVDMPMIDVDAFRVCGRSMERVFQDGELLFIASTIKNKIRLTSGDYVLVQRVDENGLYESSLKQLIIDNEGKWWLWPRSDDPEFQTPLLVTENDNAIITGRVMGRQGIFPLGRRR